MMKYLLMLTCLISLNAMATVPDSFLGIGCRSHIERVLKKHGSQDRWKRTVDPQHKVMAFRSPTKEIGKWIEIQSFPDPYVFYFERSFTKVYQWDGQTCQILNSTENKPLNFLYNKYSGFTDEKLKSLVAQSKPTMIYIWSPTMVYSMSEFKVFQTVAKEMGMDFIPLLDHNQNEAGAKKLIEGYKVEQTIQRFKSLELFMREGTVHFPTTFIVGFDKISERIFGVMTAEELKDQVADRIAALQRMN